MIKETRLSPEMIDALELAIREAVQERIDTDPDVADCYLRITPGKWLVQVMYIEESNLTTPTAMSLYSTSCTTSKTPTAAMKSGCSTMKPSMTSHSLMEK